MAPDFKLCPRGMTYIIISSSERLVPPDLLLADLSFKADRSIAIDHRSRVAIARSHRVGRSRRVGRSHVGLHSASVGLDGADRRRRIGGDGIPSLDRLCCSRSRDRDRDPSKKCKNAGHGRGILLFRTMLLGHTNIVLVTKLE